MVHPVSLVDVTGYRAHSKKAMDHIQTPRKMKPTTNDSSDDDSMDSPFEKVNAFVKTDSLRGTSADVWLDIIKNYLARSSEETREISRITGNF